MLNMHNVTDTQILICKDCEFEGLKNFFKNTIRCIDCHKAIIKIRNLEYKKSHKEHIKQHDREYRQANKEKCRTWCRNNKAKYRKDFLKNLVFNAMTRVGRIHKQLNIETKHHTDDLVGCSPKFWADWLEFQFTEEMTRENHVEVWHVDHVFPVALIKTVEDMYEIFNWKNCRPCIKDENSEKSNKIIPELIASHKKLVNKYITEVLNTTHEQLEFEFKSRKIVKLDEDTVDLEKMINDMTLEELDEFESLQETVNEEHD